MSASMASTDERGAPAAFPGFVTRFTNIVPLMEMMGFLKDHHDVFRTHFYEAWRNDPQPLKA